MKNLKKAAECTNLDEELKHFIKQKRNENSALRKLLNALENARETSSKATKTN